MITGIYRSKCVLLLSFIASTVVLLAGCAKKITLPSNYAQSGSANSAPTVYVQNNDLIGSTDKQKILSPTGANPVLVTVTPVTNKKLGYDKLAEIEVFGSATDNTLGIQKLRIQVSEESNVVYDITAQQFPDANNQVFPTLGILGTAANPANAGFSEPIILWPYTDYDIFVTATASNFGLVSQSVVVRYTCPSCAVAPRGPSNIGGGSTSGTSGTSGSSSVRTPGAFVEVIPSFRTVGSTLPSPNGAFSATVTATNPANSQDPFDAVLKSGTHTDVIPFTAGAVNALIPPIGGVGFSSDSSRAVIACYNPPSHNVATQVSFFVADTSKVFTGASSLLPPTISVYETDPSPTNGASPITVQPRIFFSQDATLALVLSAPVNGTSTNIVHVAAFDLVSGTSSVYLGGQNVSGLFHSASVSGDTINVLIEGQPALSFPIP